MSEGQQSESQKRVSEKKELGGGGGGRESEHQGGKHTVRG